MKTTDYKIVWTQLVDPGNPGNPGDPGDHPDSLHIQFALSNLETLVKAEIASGWEVSGNMIIDGIFFYQSLIKREESIIDYTVIHYNSINEFINGVKAMLSAGWVLYGDKQGTGVGGYDQAFIKY